ncbi:hypothetical protein H6P87_00564 [Rickettsia tillamookensis]|uniref:Uncharacterized protein n=1 Tax=Rickettsia tillamookensis TaxID=2761623 RepID=A0A9E6MHP8_9RICK|nr:hypothetical protein H6P87_00564 [Rickettsia tillamookensis]
MTSTSGHKHSDHVTTFKNVVRTLKETKNNPAQYENLVSSLNANTKSALEATIKSNNIIVPTQDTNKLISEILTGMQTWIDTKSHIPIELKQKFLELGASKLELFIKAAHDQFNNKWIVKEFIDNAVKTGEEGRKYLADCDCSSTDQLWAKLVEPKIESIITQQDTNKLISEILTGMQIWLDTKSHIPIELKNKFLELGSNNLEKFIESASDKFNNKWIVKEFVDNAFVPPREEGNKYLADSSCDSVDTLWAKIESLIINEDSNKATTSQASSESINSSDFKGNTSDEDSDDDIEVISQLLESKVTLNNGKKIEVKKIIDAIYNPQDLDFYLRKLTPETNQLVKKEIALKLAYDLYNDSKELSVVSAISETLGISEEFNNYTDFSLAELKDEEVNITGGDYSYLE